MSRYVIQASNGDIVKYVTENGKYVWFNHKGMADGWLRMNKENIKDVEGLKLEVVEVKDT